MNPAALSTSLTLSVPEVVTGALLSASATAAELTIAASLLPWTVTCTVLVVPSADDTVNVSDTDCPTFKLSSALFAAKVQSPLAAIENVTYVTATLVCGTKLAGLSASVIVSGQPVLSGTSVSITTTLAALMTAASFVPLIVTWTLLGVPSAVAMTKVSEIAWPA